VAELRVAARFCGPPGGHRRYPDAEIRALLETLSDPSVAGQPPA
jgi:hypothetical protein